MTHVLLKISARDCPSCDGLNRRWNREIVARLTDMGIKIIEVESDSMKHKADPSKVSAPISESIKFFPTFIIMTTSTWRSVRNGEIGVSNEKMKILNGRFSGGSIVQEQQGYSNSTNDNIIYWVSKVKETLIDRREYPSVERVEVIRSSPPVKVAKSSSSSSSYKVIEKKYKRRDKGF